MVNQFLYLIIQVKLLAELPSWAPLRTDQPPHTGHPPILSVPPLHTGCPTRARYESLLIRSFEHKTSYSDANLMQDDQSLPLKAQTYRVWRIYLITLVRPLADPHLWAHFTWVLLHMYGPSHIGRPLRVCPCFTAAALLEPGVEMPLHY